MHIKKLIALLLILTMLLSSCSPTYTAEQDAAEQDAAEQRTIDKPAEIVDNGSISENAETEDIQPSVAPTATPTPVPVPVFVDGRYQGTGLEFVRDMRIGWNLGNTFDANTDQNRGGNELDYESMWCGCKTTAKMIESIRDAGFMTIRIPVSWHNHVSGDDFTISSAWLDRVQEVVDYAMELDMFVIINTHHDVYHEYYYPSSEYMDTSRRYIGSVWAQVAERFKDYDHHLIFESMNEPRLKGTEYEWNMASNDAVKDSKKCINELNQLFTDTVRATGGYNEDRFLMVPGYDASPDGATAYDFVLPDDTVEDRLIVSVHAYTPYNFALQGPTESGSVSEFDAKKSASGGAIDYFLKQLYNKYAFKKIPVVIGEFGARDKSGNTGERVEFAAYYVKMARKYGITCCWWDNNSYSGSGENFGIFKRNSCTFPYPDIIDALIENSK